MSAVVREGSHLWVANDETTSLERLTLEAATAPRDHRSFDLTDVLDAARGQGEIDIEGLDVAGDTLWLLGSHSAARKRVKDNHDPDRRGMPWRQSRSASAGGSSPGSRPRTLPDADAQPERRAAAAQLSLAWGEGLADLLDLLAEDPHLGSFIRLADASRPIPGKDNGIDCEGLAVAGDRVFIGLRGPVLRGWAMIIELEVGDGPGLAPQPIGPGGRRYRKHFLDLRGLGVRDLCRHGNDLLVLAGPTMELDGRTTRVPLAGRADV